MNILLLGDIMGPSGRKAVIEKLPKIIKKKKIDFVIVNGENAADPGVGITKKYFEEFFKAGADVNYNRKSCLGPKRSYGFYYFRKKIVKTSKFN